MATIDEKNQTITFSAAEKQAAWNRAPKLVNLNANNFRLCYICKLRLDHKLPVEKTTKQNKPIGWMVDLINAKKMDLSQDNLIAIHYGCLANRKKLNQSKVLRKVESLIWRYNE